jgi:hypothetical protein
MAVLGIGLITMGRRCRYGNGLANDPHLHYTGSIRGRFRWRTVLYISNDFAVGDQLSRSPVLRVGGRNLKWNSSQFRLVQNTGGSLSRDPVLAVDTIIASHHTMSK